MQGWLRPERVRPALVHGRGPQAAAHHQDLEGPSPDALRDCGDDVRSGPGRPGITSLLQLSEDYVRNVIHPFNKRRFDALDPNGVETPEAHR